MPFEKRQGGIEAKLAATVWLPLANDLKTLDEQMDVDNENVEDSIRPDAIIQKVVEIPNILPKSTTFRPTRLGTSPANSTRHKGSVYQRIISSVPDFDSCNSNSSDGS